MTKIIVGNHLRTLNDAIKYMEEFNGCRREAGLSTLDPERAFEILSRYDRKTGKLIPEGERASTGYYIIYARANADTDDYRTPVKIYDGTREEAEEYARERTEASEWHTYTTGGVRLPMTGHGSSKSLSVQGNALHEGNRKDDSRKRGDT